MFKTAIITNPLVNDAANSFFGNIQGSSYGGDISFLATLRALVHPRMGEEDSLLLGFGDSAYTAGDVATHAARSVIKAICPNSTERRDNYIYIHSFRNHQEDNYACLELVKRDFCNVYTEWHRLEKVTEFYKKQFLTTCFINPERKSVIIFVDNLDVRKMHYLQCSIFAFLPWYFDPEKGVSEVEMELITSLREKTPDKYNDVMEKIASQYDFRTARIRQLLSGFETRFEKIEARDVKRRIQDRREAINYLNEQIGDNLREKHELEIKLLGLEARIANTTEESEIMEYFLCNDKLVLLEVTDNAMLFGVKTYIEYFDEDMAEAAINNKNSYLYHPNSEDGSRYIPTASIEKLMRAIFINQTLKIKVCAAYEFRLNGNVDARHDFSFDHEFKDCMPNPHINGYRCMGNYQRTINDLLDNRNYISALEQCVASAKSLNFGDSTVMHLFARAIYNIDCDYNNRCIELPDGKIVNPTEAITWLEEQESDKNE